jgi:RNA methyltransferase, TrmH family
MITSRTNAQVKYVRRLQTERRFRHDEGAFVVEGTRWLRELAQNGLTPRALYATPAWGESAEGQELAATFNADVTLVDEPVMAAMSDTESAPGVLAVLPIAPRPLPAQPTLLLIIDALNNPGNLGTILRTAAAAGADGVLLGPDNVDPYNPKTIRGSMGAIVRLPILATNWEVIHRLVSGMAVWLAVAQDGTAYSDVDWRVPSAILIGSEAFGAGVQAERLATGPVTIPMRDATESLNAAVAAGILLFEAARQRTS